MGDMFLNDLKIIFFLFLFKRNIWYKRFKIKENIKLLCIWNEVFK